MPRSSPSRTRRRNRWQALSPEELQAQAADQRTQDAGAVGFLPWQPHPTLVALQERLQLVADCWNLLDGTGGQSRRGLYLPQGSKEPEAAYRQRLANARPSGFFRDALRTYAGMLASVQWRELPGSLAGVLQVSEASSDAGTTSTFNHQVFLQAYRVVMGMPSSLEIRATLSRAGGLTRLLT